MKLTGTSNLGRLRKIYEAFPKIPVPQHLDDDDDMQKLSEALVAAKIRVEGCSSFLKAAIKSVSSAHNQVSFKVMV